MPTDTGSSALHGAITAIFTPFDEDGRLRLDLFPDLLDFQRNNGIDGVVVCGTNGEGTSLSVTERKQALETVLEYRGGLSVIAGTGAASITDAIELTKHAAECKADAALVLPPFFFKSPDVRGLSAYFRKVMDAADLPVLLYNIPQMTAVPITNELLDSLLDHTNLAGVKDSAGERERSLEFINRYPNLKIFTGNDRLAADSYSNGGAGAISGGANAFPEIVSAVRTALLEGGEAAARTAQQKLNALVDITSRYPFVSSGKAILVHRCVAQLGVRPPLVSMGTDAARSLIADLTAARFL